MAASFSLYSMVLSILLTLSCPFGALAAKGGSFGGGGQTVDIQNRPNLRDLVDRTVCRWTTGRQFQLQYASGFDQVEKNLDQIHWYMADAYKREIAHIRFCMTEGKLKQIPADDQDGLTIFEERTNQIAIRLNDAVYINMELFRAMEAQHQTFLFAHEITHSFLPMNIPRRNESLRSFIAMLAQIPDERTLAINIEANHIDMPETVDSMNAFRVDILNAMDERAPLMSRWQSAQKITYVRDQLWGADQYLLTVGLVQKRNILFQKIVLAILTGNVDQVKYLYFTQQVDPNQGLFYQKTESNTNDVIAALESLNKIAWSDMTHVGQWPSVPRSGLPGLYFALENEKTSIVSAFLEMPGIQVKDYDLVNAHGSLVTENLLSDDRIENVRLIVTKLLSQDPQFIQKKYSLTKSMLGGDYWNRDIRYTYHTNPAKVQVARVICETARLTKSDCAHLVRGEMW